MTIRDVCNWVLDQSAWWLIPLFILSVMLGALEAALGLER